MEKYYFFDSNESIGDERWYSASDWSRVLSKFLENGIYNEGSNLNVTAAGTNMTVTVGTGVAFLDGHMYENESSLSLSVDAAEATLDRIDLVVLRLDLTEQNRYIKAIVKKGVPASSPVSPEIENSTFIKEFPIAEIRVTKGKSTIAQSQITDKRPADFVDPFVDGSRITDLEQNTYTKAETDTLADQVEADVINWVKGFGIGVLDGIVFSGDLNTRIPNGNYYASSATNRPYNGNGYLIVHNYNTAYCNQIYIVAGTPHIYIRWFISGVWTGWSQIIVSDPDGIVTNAKQSFVSAARTGTRQLVSGSTLTKMTFNTVRKNTQGEWSNNRFTAKTSGYYQINLGTQLLTEQPSPYIAVFQNGIEYQRLDQGYQNVNGLSGSMIIELTAGQYLEFYLYFSGTNNANTEHHVEIIKVA